MVGVETVIVREDPFRGFSGMISVFERDGDVYRTQPRHLETFNEQTFLTTKPPNGFRIFCLGGSSSHGFPWGAESAFTDIAGDALAVSHPALRVEAVNVSGVSYAMHRLNIVAEELLACDPDVLIIYSGHNEFVEPAFVDALKRRGAARTRIEYGLAHSRLYAAMQSVMQRTEDKHADANTEFGTRVERDQTRIFSGEEKEKIVAEYRWRLARLVRVAQKNDVKVVLPLFPATCASGVRATRRSQPNWMATANASGLTISMRVRNSLRAVISTRHTRPWIGRQAYSSGARGNSVSTGPDF